MNIYREALQGHRNAKDLLIRAEQAIPSNTEKILMKNLFAYGTLMCEEIMYEVSGIKPKSSEATLYGYKRVRIKGELYPGIIPCASSKVEGIIYFDIPDKAWQRLDRFEGDMYCRQKVAIQLPNGIKVLSDTFIIADCFENSLEETEWNFAEFLANGKETFRKTYLGYKKVE